MRRWQDAKFGIFIHFGPWSQTEKGLIWPMTLTCSAKKRERDLNLYRTFNPIHFDATEWARAIRRSGARYAVFTTKHHDGFCNFDTALTNARITSPECPYSSSKSPDITRDFVDAMRAQKLMVGLYYSNVDWRHPDGVWHSHAKFDEAFPLAHPDRWRRFVSFEQGQVRELLTHYGPIDLFWFDVWWPKSGQGDAVPMLQMMRRLQPNMLINDRGTDGFADFVTAEQGIPNPVPDGPWESCFTISEGNGFWYKGPRAKYKSAAELIRLLADVASKGGNLLLNIGPKPDGSLVEQEVQRMEEIGNWLARNGQAIYGTTRGPLAHVPPWGRVTRRGSRLYLIVFDWPKPGTPLRLQLTQHVTAASLLGESAPVAFQALPDHSGVELHLPSAAPDPVASVIQLDFSESQR
ncbi:MAG TPA: alpha-L-fucosidase [Tepidisphaeraceae bacterium]|nr:alpha-L-fucosidase [Tepidisphaeraceae bacterium]